MAASVEYRQEEISSGETKADDLSLFLDFNGVNMNLELLQNSDQFRKALGSESENSLMAEKKSIIHGQDPPVSDELLNSENNTTDYDWLLSPPRNLVPALEMEEQETLTSHSLISNATSPDSRLENPLADSTSTTNLVPKLPALSSNCIKFCNDIIKPPSPSRKATSTTRSTLPSVTTPLRSSTPTSRATIGAATKPFALSKRSITPTPRSSTLTVASKTTSRSSTPTPLVAAAKSVSRSSTPTQRPSIISAAKSASRSSTPTPLVAAAKSVSRSSTPTQRPSIISAAKSASRSSTPTPLVAAAKSVSRSSTPTQRPSIISAAKSASRSSTPTPLVAAAKSVSRSSTPTQRPSIISAAKSASRSSTPTPLVAAAKSVSRSSTPTQRPSIISAAKLASRSSTPTQPSGSVNGNSMKARSTSPSVKSRPSKNPPNVFPVIETNIKAIPKRTSCSPSKGVVSNGGSVKSGITRSRGYSYVNDDDDDINPVLMGTKKVERVVNMRKLAPPRQQYISNTSGKLSVSQDKSGFGRSLSKKSFDMALRHLDIRRSMPGNMRAMITKVPASSVYSVRAESTKTQIISALDSPLKTSISASSDHSQ